MCQTSLYAINKELYLTRWLIISCFSVAGWQFVFWRGENWRNSSYTEETQSFPQVRIVRMKFVPTVFCLWCIFIGCMSISLRLLLAVMTSLAGTCLHCCLLSCQWKAAREEHCLRYQHWKSFCLQIKFVDRTRLSSALVFSLVSIFCFVRRCCLKCCSVCVTPCSGPSTQVVKLSPPEWVMAADAFT